MKNSLVLFFIITIFNQNYSLGQATRTWVSGVGDDANPCSRTAPCKTFAGTISKTAAGGEINVLDPAGVGSVTITKSISIVVEGVTGGVLVSGINGIVINAASTDNIILRGIDFEGLGTSTNGINVLSAKSILIENCIINGFSAASSGNGINVAPTAGQTNVIVQNTRISNCNTAINVAPSGIFVANVDLLQVLLGFNETGIKSTGTGATVRISNSSILNNTTGVTNSTGNVISFGNNNIAGNTNNNAMTVQSQL